LLTLSLLAISLASVSAETTSYASVILPSLVVPGLGQALHKHPVRGAFLFTLETVLAGTWISENSQRREFLDSAQSRTSVYDLFRDDFETKTDAGYWSKDSDLILNMDRTHAEINSDSIKALFHQSNRNMQMFWAAGIYIYNLCDAFEIAWRARNPVQGKRSVTGAMVRSLLLPGWGQLYNQEYGKFGMVLMAEIGILGSLYERQKIADFFASQNTKYSQTARSLSPLPGPDAPGLSLPEKSELSLLRARLTSLNGQKAEYAAQQEIYYSKRNGFIWYMAAVYLYCMFDAVVDAHLHDFDEKVQIGFEPPVHDNYTIQLTYHF
jgi:hypothetical protein